MNELVKLVASKTGLSEDMARTAVEVVLKALKAKLPAPIGNQLEGILDGKVNPNDLMKGGGGLMGMLKGLMGGK